jgi:transposase-like protein
VDTLVDARAKRRRRRRHSQQFKSEVVASCRQPGVSIAAVALANGLNANLLRRWVVSAQQRRAPDITQGELSATVPAPWW